MTQLDALLHDVRYVLRQLRRAPAFTLVAVLTLALGVGATTAIFSAVHAVVLRPLPFDEPDRLVRVYESSPSTSAADEVSPKVFAAWRAGTRAFARMTAIETRSATLVDRTARPEQVAMLRTTADYFPLLGVRPLLGRAFTRDEDRPGANHVLVLGHRYWLRRFGGDPAVVGRSVLLDAVPHTVIGVMPATLEPPTGVADLWTPIAFTPEQETSVTVGYLDVVARLRPGTTMAVAQADAEAVMRRIAGAGDGARGARVVSYAEDTVGAYRGRLFVLLGAVGLVLLIACVNVANLLLARGVVRSTELGIRAALGAGRGRVVRQLLVESLVLGVAGGTAGLALAHGALQAIRAMGLTGVPRLDHARIDGTALAVALAVTLGSSALFGLLPALRASRGDLQSTLRQGARTTSGGVPDVIRQALVTVEVALSLVLLVGAGLLIRSAIMTERVEPGLDPRNVWSGWVTLPAAAYPTPERVAGTYERIRTALLGVPGVQSAAVVSVAPFTGIQALGLFVPEGRPLDRQNALMGNLRLVSPGVFRTLGIPLREGRDVSDGDDTDAPSVVVVNEAFARVAWPGERAVGKRLFGGGGGTVPREVVGVVGSTREDGLREAPRPAIYVPYRQAPPVLWEGVQNSMFLVARTAVAPHAITREIEDAVSAVDRDVPVSQAHSLEERIAEQLATVRFNRRLLVALGVVGLLLAVVGIHGVISYFVGTRAREIGVRMALGATQGRIVAQVVGHGLRPVLVGIVVGALAAAVASRALASQLFGVGTTDPIAFLAAAAAVAIVAALVAALPARRAARLDPRRALEA